MDNNITVIGDSVTVRGNLSGEEDLQVLGRIEGSIDLNSTLVVAESGIVKAEVSVKNAIISGVVVGNVHASESIELTREGRMVGDISSPRVIIVDGASFRGNVDMGDMENMPKQVPARERPSAPRVAPPQARAEPPRAAVSPEEDDVDDVDDTELAMKVPEPAPERAVPQKQKHEQQLKKKPSFMNPPKAQGLPKKKKKRVVVKRK